MSKSKDTTGYKNKQSNIPALVIKPGLQTIENVFPENDYWVELLTTEFTSICPKTGLPDFARLVLRYVPASFLVEEKSLKLYLTAFRNIGIFQENATNKIFDDFIRAIKPRKATIVAEWNARGGIGVKVERSYEASSRPIFPKPRK
jgi:7-cyano-7-deazaguanine reductase